MTIARAPSLEKLEVKEIAKRALAAVVEKLIKSKMFKEYIRTKSSLHYRLANSTAEASKWPLIIEAWIVELENSKVEIIIKLEDCTSSKTDMHRSTTIDSNYAIGSATKAIEKVLKNAYLEYEQICAPKFKKNVDSYTTFLNTLSETKKFMDKL
jgi:hypothetical protein